MTTLSTGLYRTTLPYPGQEQAVPAQRLVLLNTDNEHGKPVILMPEKAVSNQWLFRNRGMLVNEASWLDTLVALPKQGFYTVQKEINGPQGAKLPVSLLVQLGFMVSGQPVVFPGTFKEGAMIAFGTRGMPISDLQIDNLVVATFKLAAAPPKPKDAKDAKDAKPDVKTVH